MNYIWSGMILVSLAAGAINGNISEVLAAGLEGAGSAFYTVLGFAGLMCFWSGILALCEAGGITKVLSKVLSPVLGRVFGKDSKALNNISMNVTANILGMGNAATPPGVEAMRILDEENKSKYPNRKMCIFAVMNTSSLQIIPATVAAMRTAAGSTAPFDIIIPVWITSAVSLAAAVGAALVLFGKRQ